MEYVFYKSRGDGTQETASWNPSFEARMLDGGLGEGGHEVKETPEHVDYLQR